MIFALGALVPRYSFELFAYALLASRQHFYSWTYPIMISRRHMESDAAILGCSLLALNRSPGSVPSGGSLLETLDRSSCDVLGPAKMESPSSGATRTHAKPLQEGKDLNLGAREPKGLPNARNSLRYNREESPPRRISRVCSLSI